MQTNHPCIFSSSSTQTIFAFRGGSSEEVNDSTVEHSPSNNAIGGNVVKKVTEEEAEEEEPQTNVEHFEDQLAAEDFESLEDEDIEDLDKVGDDDDDDMDEKSDIEDDFVKVEREDLMDDNEDDNTNDRDLFLDEEEEEEEDLDEPFVEDNVFEKEGQALMVDENDELDDDDDDDNDVENQFFKKEFEDDSVPLSSQILETATGESATEEEEENSSAFVDRMELADAYDHEDDDARDTKAATMEMVEDSADVTATMAAVAAHTIVSTEEESPDSSLDDNVVDVANASNGTASPAATEITNEMKKILVQQLGYKAKDISLMRPEIAAMIISMKKQKPVEGMPANWYLPGNIPKSLRSLQVQKAVKKVSIAVGVVSAIALAGWVGDELGIIDVYDILYAIEDIPENLAAIPVAVWSVLSGPFRTDKGKQQKNSNASSTLSAEL